MSPAAPASFERVPPQDLAAEQCVLGAMMLSKDAIADAVERLREEDFYTPAHQAVYGIVLDLYAGESPPTRSRSPRDCWPPGSSSASGAPRTFTLWWPPRR